MAQHHNTPWNYQSGVYACSECDGTGEVHSHRRATIDDPYPTKPCELCAGPADAVCPVCGYEHVHAGFDCLVCETLDHLTDAEFAAFSAADFAKALTHAVKARADHIAKVNTAAAHAHLAALPTERRAQLEREWVSA